MKVEVQLFATLGAYLPEGTPGDGVTLTMPDGTTVAGVMGSLGIPPDLPCLIVVNGRDAAPEQVLADGDCLVMFPPLAGGAARP